jgi:acyl-CoA reductase-like NAD-dependent aldehyde dehydrogenase
MSAAPGGRLASLDPWSGEVVGEVVVATPGDVDAAVARAELAQRSWATTPVPERAEVLRRFADLVEDDADRLTELLVAEVGKRRAEAAGEVEWTALSARWYADHPPPEEEVAGAAVRRVPLGVVAAITPWNVPVTTAAWKWLPALMAGNSVVWKPSELAPVSADVVLGLWGKAGLPDGLLEVVHGAGDVGSVLVEHPDVRGIHFTGSTATGRRIAVAAARRLVRCALELGGLNPVVVFEDADLDAAVDDVVAAGTAINVGDPRDPGTTLGPLVTGAAADTARQRVDAAVRAGATVLGRSAAPDHPGFFPATLLTDLPAGDGLRTHELFAPVIAVESFGTDEEGWSAANATTYGLAASVHTASPDRWAQARARLRAGVVGVNRRGDAVDLEAPFGGLGDSGNGYPEGGLYVYDALTDHQAYYGPRT